MNDRSRYQEASGARASAPPRALAPMTIDMSTVPAALEMAEQYRVPVAALVMTFRKVAMPKDHSDEELISCMVVAREHNLNPLVREVYFMRTRAGTIQAIVGIDGWITKINKHPDFDGLEIIENWLDDKKTQIGSMTCSIFLKSRKRPTTITEILSECVASGGPVWKVMPNRMLRNRVISQCARIAFGFAGIMTRDEMEDWQHREASDQSIDITPKGSITEAQTDELMALIAEGGADAGKFNAYFSVVSISDLPADRFEDAKKALEKVAERNKATAIHAAAEQEAAQ